MKKIIAVLLSVFMMLSVSACGGKSETDAGKYTVYEMSAEGITFDYETLKSTGMNEMITLELKEDGTGTLDFGDGATPITWKQGTITIAGTDVPYTSKDGKISFEYMGNSVVFEKVGSASGGDSSETPTNVVSGEGAMNFGDYEATYKGSKITKDAYGNDAIVISFVYKNNSSGQNSFFYSINYSAKQKDSDLYETTVYSNPEHTETYDTDVTSINAGESLEVQIPLTLSNLKDDVTLTLSDTDNGNEQTLVIKLADCEVDEQAGSSTSADDLSGDWYGWWIVTDATGGYADSNNNWWDICATISFDADGNGTMLLWDEDYARDDLLGEVYLTLNSSKTATSTGGMFANDQITDGDWNIDLDLDDYPNTIVFSDYYEDEHGSFAYGLYLHKWGEEWTEDEDNLPYYYSDWYLPLIQNGESMPDKIN